MGTLGQSSTYTSTATLIGAVGNSLPAVTVFVCANCARPGEAPTSAARSRPILPDFAWPMPVREVLVPCTGRLQPEHVLKAFDSGTSLVCAVACQEDNCHYLEGSQRCARRVDYIRSILDAIGLGAQRLLLFHLPGTAAEDMTLATGRPSPARSSEDLDARLATIRDQVMRTLQGLPPNPLHEAPVDEAAGELYQEVNTSDDNDEE
jgi:coenzyme F420-reducing hydrogenase delta subunit